LVQILSKTTVKIISLCLIQSGVEYYMYWYLIITHQIWVGGKEEHTDHKNKATMRRSETKSYVLTRTSRNISRMRLLNYERRILYMKVVIHTRNFYIFWGFEGIIFLSVFHSLTHSDWVKIWVNVRIKLIIILILTLGTIKWE